MLLGIVSDTHGFVPDTLAEHFAGVDHIIHAGDVGSASVIKELSAMAPTTIVRGNIDGPALYFLEETETFSFEGIRFGLIHNAGDLLRPRRDVMHWVENQGIDILISGHYHSFWVHTIKDTQKLWISPGACGNSGHHVERLALRLRIKAKDAKATTLASRLELEKVHLGRRGYL